MQQMWSENGEWKKERESTNNNVNTTITVIIIMMMRTKKKQPSSDIIRLSWCMDFTTFNKHSYSGVCHIFSRVASGPTKMKQKNIATVKLLFTIRHLNACQNVWTKKTVAFTYENIMRWRFFSMLTLHSIWMCTHINTHKAWICHIVGVVFGHRAQSIQFWWFRNEGMK